MIVLIVIFVLVVLIVLWGFTVYNKLVKLRVSANEGSSEIQIQLKRRHDLIPNLVSTVKGYAAHEASTLEAVVAARAQAVQAQQSADLTGQAQTEGMLGNALGRLLAISEAYPDLKANSNFLNLQNELTATEDRIQAARRFYNMTVKELNTKIQQIPSNFVASIGRFKAKEFFELEDPAEAAVPAVVF